MLFGAIVGVLFSIKNDTSATGPLKVGLFVGSVGSVLSAFSLSLLEYTIFIVYFGLDITYFVELFIIFFAVCILIGSIVGGLIGFYYWNRQRKPKESLVDEEFFEDLK